MDSDDIIKRALAFSIDEIILRYAEEEGLTVQEAERHARELKRYLALCAVTGEAFGMRGPLDKLWHAFVLDTQLYQRFCNEVAGRFIHHVPSRAGASRQLAQKQSRQFLRFAKLYNQTWNEMPPEDLWLGQASAAIGSRAWWEDRLSRFARGATTLLGGAGGQRVIMDVCAGAGEAPEESTTGGSFASRRSGGAIIMDTCAGPGQAPEEDDETGGSLTARQTSGAVLMDTCAGSGQAPEEDDETGGSLTAPGGRGAVIMDVCAPEDSDDAETGGFLSQG